MEARRMIILQFSIPCSRKTCDSRLNREPFDLKKRIRAFKGAVPRRIVLAAVDPCILPNVSRAIVERSMPDQTRMSAVPRLGLFTTRAALSQKKIRGGHTWEAKNGKVNGEQTQEKEWSAASKKIILVKE